MYMLRLNLLIILAVSEIEGVRKEFPEHGTMLREDDPGTGEIYILTNLTLIFIISDYTHKESVTNENEQQPCTSQCPFLTISESKNKNKFI